jgi:sugar/nucleoside kinase (ribokinase family)
VDAAPAGLFAGLATLDVVHRVTRLPAPDEKVRALSQELVAGGPAANAAITYAALRGRATLLTALGHHPLARLVCGELVARGVDVVDLTPDVAAAPPVAACTVVDSTGERIVSSVGAASSAVAAPDPVDVGDARVVLLDGHHPQVGLAVARAASAAGVPVVLDAGSWKPVVSDLLPLVTVAACGAAFRVPGSDGDVLDAVLAAGVSVAVVTAGPEPVRWRTAEDAGEVAVPVVAATDTMGAGDVFHGALAWALATRPAAPVEASLEFAASAAALRCSVPGQRAWLTSPRLAEVRTQWLTS